MKLDAKMVNLLGLLAMVIVLGLGTIGIVMPMYDGVQATQTELDSQRATNNNLGLKLTALNVAEQRETEIQANVDSLRVKLPEGQAGDTALQAISNALELSGSVIINDEFAAPLAFSVRGSEESDNGGTPTETEPVAGNDSEQDAPGAPAETPVETPAASPEVPPQSEPERVQAEAILTLGVTGHEMATQFIDALAQNPRALLVTSSELTDDEVEGMPATLKVTMSIFYYGVVATDE